MKQVAAVLVPVYRSVAGDIQLVLVRRSEGGIHGGQLAFPGGKPEPEDQSLLDTALRETQEEIGLGRESIEVLEHLPVAHTMSSEFCVFPFLARVVVPQRWNCAAREVAEIIEVKVGEFALPEASECVIEQLQHWPEPREIEYYRVGAHRVWGLTYRIIKPLVPRLLSGEWPL